jgi:ATP phosphoribosyltransferase
VTAPPLRLALPSKGRLAEPAFRLFHDAGMPVEPDGRRLRLRLDEHGLDILLARADDIPVLLDDRAVDVGIAGQNQVVESGLDLDALLPLGFGRCRLALAAPAGGPVRRVADLAGLRVATSFPATTAAFLRSRSVAANLISISGSVELAPSLGAAEAVADLVSSGETLRQNGLVELETILESEAVLLARRGLDPALAERVEHLRVGLASVLAARPKRYIMLNAHDDDLDAILELLPGIDAPTVLPLARSGMHAVHAVVDLGDVVRLLGPLKERGASGILVLPIEHLIP